MATPNLLQGSLPDSALIITGSGKDLLSEKEVRDIDQIHHVQNRFQIHQTFWSEIFDQGIDDDKFIAGEQWSEEIKKERQEERRPMLTYNLLPALNRQITNKVREDRPQVKVSPVETTRSKTPKIPNTQKTNDYQFADIYSGIIKNIEHVSRADQAYDTALKHAADHGFGYFYMLPVWSETDPFVQDLRIFRVKNSYSVMLDPDAQEADFRDMQDAFIFGKIKRATFDLKYPDAAPVELAVKAAGMAYEGWYDTESMMLAQYFFIRRTEDHVIRMSNGIVTYLSDVKDVLDEIKKESGIHRLKGKENTKEVMRPNCIWQKLTGAQVLEEVKLPFSAVPIFPVLGEEIMVDGRMRYESAIRHAKDAQRSYNYWKTSAAESVALAPRAPYMVTQKMIQGHEDMYETANVTNHPYLLFNADDKVPGGAPSRDLPKQLPAAELAVASQDATDIQNIVGIHDASLGKEGQEKSGKAILARQTQGSIATFQFPDNLARAQQQMGRLAVEAIPQIMDTQRIVRIRLPDDTEDFVEINTTVEDRSTGKHAFVRDINYGKYDVVMDTGPSYQTQRAEAQDLQLELMKILGPEKGSLIAHIMVKNMGLPGSDEVASILRKTLPDQFKSEEERLADLPKGVSFDEDGQMVDAEGNPYQPPMTPEMQIQQETNRIEKAKVEAEIETSKGKQATSLADIKQAEAKIVEAQAKMQAAANEQGPGPEIDYGEIESIVQQVMKEHELDSEAHKAATMEQVSDAEVDILRRIKDYTDSKVPESAGGAEARMPIRLEYEYDDEGKIQSTVPVFEEVTIQ